MKLEKFLLKSFESPEQKDNYSVVTPQGSKFLRARVLHDGIYLWYLVPLLITNKVTEEYLIVAKDKDVPDGYEFIDVLDSIIEVPEHGQGIMIFPIFKKK